MLGPRDQRATSTFRAVTAVAALTLLAAGCGGSGSDAGAGPAASDSTDVAADAADSGSPEASDDDPGSGTTPEDEAPSTVAPATNAEQPGWSDQEILLNEIATVNQPLALVGRSGTGDLYVAEKTGAVRLITRTVKKNQPDRFDVARRPVLDLSEAVSGDTEQGLLDIVFSSDGRQLFVSYTDTEGNNVIDRYTMASDRADTDSRRQILTVDQPFANHNGGGLAFGPDGYLYIGIGDGGQGGDPLGSGQDTDTLLGSILRIDPDGASGESTYAVPNGNPFVDGGGAPELWLYGVRNPWRFSFDQDNGDLWIADVGQNRFEEVNLLPAPSAGYGNNLGWNQMEGLEAYEGGSEPADHVKPILAYTHENNRCSVTGGAVYRGEMLPPFEGVYVFGDFCSGEVFGAQPSAGGVIFRNLDLTLPRNTLSSFGTDQNDEMFLMSLDGGIFRLEPALVTDPE